jgi:hypothetical protein
LFAVSALLCVVSAEVGARAFWSAAYGVPFRSPDRILYAYYPELEMVDREQPAHGDAFYDILLLGASTLHHGWSQVAQSLSEQLALHGRRNVRIFNLALPGHTSRDSWLKYAALGKARFELVLVYHGINEARANNVPPKLFREDYAHYSWYESVNALAPYHGAASFALPYTLRHLAVRLRSLLKADQYVPTDSPRKEWVRYGRDPRSAVPFRQNLSAILDLARGRGDRVMLMTFAIYVPQDYSLEAFNAKRLNYALHQLPLELWGDPEHVVRTVAVHNEIVRGLAAQHEGVLFVDQARLMPGSGRYFNDPCHFTVIGAAKFVANLLGVLLR